MCIIYLITNTITGMQYVGQTVDTLDARFMQHKYSAKQYKRYLEHPDKYAYKGTCTYLYRAMNSYGDDNFRIDLIVECESDELDELEVYFISEYNTLAPSGYNLTTGGGHFQHCEETKKLMSKRVREVMLSHIDNFRTSDKTKGLPPYIAYKLTGSYEAYYVNNHPHCKRKYFSSSKYGSIEAAKEACREFVNELNQRNEMYVVTGPGGAPMKGLRPLKNGYQVRKSINGNIIEKSFNESQYSREQNLQRAISYINSLT